MTRITGKKNLIYLAVCEIFSNKQTGTKKVILIIRYGMFVCVYQRIFLTARTVWFSFTVKFLIWPGKFM